MQNKDVKNLYADSPRTFVRVFVYGANTSSWLLSVVGSRFYRRISDIYTISKVELKSNSTDEFLHYFLVLCEESLNCSVLFELPHLRSEILKSDAHISKNFLFYSQLLTDVDVGAS